MKIGRFGAAALVLTMLTSMGLGLPGCAPSAPSTGEAVLIGYAGGLSGRGSSLGVAGRDGALLAVADANASGGIDGRPIALAVADDSAPGTTADEAVRDLVERGVVAVVGPMTSSAAWAGARVATESRVPLIGPTVSTDMLSGKDDWFFRTYPTNDVPAGLMARRMAALAGEVHAAVVYDLANEAHTATWTQNFSEAVQETGGSVVLELPFTSGKNPHYSELAEQIAASGADCVLLLANSIDAAMIAQRIAVLGLDVTIGASEWTATEDLILYGGSAVEGLMFYNSYDRSYSGGEYRAVVDRFRERFGYEPDFGAIQAYEATSILIEAARFGADPETIRETLTGTSHFDGLQGPIVFDRFGDVQRTHFPMTVSDGVFVAAGTP